MPNTPPVFETRRANLRALIEQYQGPSSLARRLGLSGPSFLSQITGGHRHLQEKTARRWEELLGLEAGWLDRPREGLSVRSVDLDLIVAVVHTVGRVAEHDSKTVRPVQFAQVVVLAYEDALAKGRIDEQFVRRLLNLTR